MSETPKTQTEFDKTFRDIMSHEESVPQSPEARTEIVANRFYKGEMPHTLEELAEISSEVGKEWQEEGFEEPHSFLDTTDNLVLVAKEEKAPETPKPAWVPGEEIYDDEEDELTHKESPKTWRVLADDHVSTVTIPPEWQGDSQRYRSMSGNVSIYKLPDEIDEAELPEEMQALVGKFGRRLSISYGPEYSTLGEEAIGLDKVSRNVASKKHDDYERDEEAAYAIEDAGQRAAAKVRKGLFMSATKHARLQEEAYRREIDKRQ